VPKMRRAMDPSQNEKINVHRPVDTSKVIFCDKWPRDNDHVLSAQTDENAFCVLRDPLETR
jgi:hypothetical protein